jgi:predicted RNA-binding Zn ribbon-like protein
MVRSGDTFDWSGGHPALDFVNTLDERPSDAPIETLVSYDDLVRFTELAGIIEVSVAKALRSRLVPNGARVVLRARKLRERLFAVLSAHRMGMAADRRTLEAIAEDVRRAHAARTITAPGLSGMVTYSWMAADAADVPLHACALAVEALLVSSDPERIRKCGAQDCDVYFIDTSKAHRRQWCSMQNCGNREKQRRWRAGQ